IAVNVISNESIQKCVEEVGQLVQEEGLNCLINNAAINVEGDIHTVSAEMMIKNYHTNAVAPLMMTKAFLPLLKNAASREASGTISMGIQRAAVINMSSKRGSIQLNKGEYANDSKLYPYIVSKIVWL
ncbi:D-beta-hydroxybutyrate dehydrogenase, mitochondrial, partial [Phyllopteryx taeniolatus]|uniref:D-beta-hydroxybutyrate dehydrogenase, mitochondrial n=1 Tax=Phyllopteryx taeniolatus TaxID=161469 RepID=UPI002AD2178B